jgi:hypothetical protein
MVKKNIKFGLKIRVNFEHTWEKWACLCLKFGTWKINKYRSLRIEYFVGVFRLKADSEFRS